MMNTIKNARVLIVDDNAGNLALLQAILEAKGYRIEMAENGEEALEKANEFHPDLILLDVMMPVMDGFETCQQLKKSRETKEIPVIFLTAKTDVEDVIKGFEIGAVDYIAKPFNEKELLVRVNTHIKLKTVLTNLVESEKIASLGMLVTGMAHEINTPLGTAITAASFNNDLVMKQLSNFADVNPDSDQWKSLLEEMREGQNIILKNLKKMSQLMNDFKRISTDYSEPTRSKFNLKEYLDYILFTLKEWFQEKKHNLSIKCESIVLNSYPRDFTLIISNLIINSIAHGYEDGEWGNIFLNIFEKDQQIHIQYEDDGKGISEEKLRHIFDPFFTTKRGKHMGLGLSIVYNIITQKLKGEIHCESNINQGTRFTIDFPINQ